MSIEAIEKVRVAYFSDDIRWQSWLDVEAVLAETQGEMGMIPQAAAEEIARNCDLAKLDKSCLREKIDTTMAPVFALTNVLAEVSGEAGAYVHWGATTQNIIETGRLLVLRRVQERLKLGLAEALNNMADLAEENAEQIMVGRTNRQNALPITLGFKIAGWIDEFIRVADQLVELEPRLFQLRFGGAIGGYHSFGADGPQMADKLATKLNLTPSLVPNRTAVDPLIEYVTKLSMIGVATGRVTNELYLSMTEEIGEFYEQLGPDVVGSSTMPQKSNPKLLIELRARSNQLRGKAASVLIYPSPSHEGDAATNRELGIALEESCPLALFVVNKFNSVLSKIKPNRDRMKANFLATHEMMATEGLMMRLACDLGRRTAHDLIHDLVAKAAQSGESFRTLLLQEKCVSDNLSMEEIDDLLSHENKTGQCIEIAKAAAVVGRTKAHMLASN